MSSTFESKKFLYKILYLVFAWPRAMNNSSLSLVTNNIRKILGIFHDLRLFLSRDIDDQGILRSYWMRAHFAL